MTTAFLQEFKDNQPDKLVETLKIELTEDQHTYLQENKLDMRTLLLKKFNLRFKTTHSKIQLTRAIEVMNEPKVKPTGLRKDRQAPKKRLLPQTSKGMGSANHGEEETIHVISRIRGWGNQSGCGV